MALLLGTTAPDIMLFPYIKLPATGSRIPSMYHRRGSDECDDKTSGSGQQAGDHQNPKVTYIKTVLGRGYPIQIRLPGIRLGAWSCKNSSHSLLVESCYIDSSNTRGSETDSISRTFTEIKSPTINVGSSIVDRHYGTSIEADTKSCSKRECLMSSSKAVLIVSRSASGKVTMEPRSIPRANHRQSC